MFLRGEDLSETMFGQAPQASPVARPARSPESAGGRRSATARAVAQRLGIHHDVMEFAAEFAARGVSEGLLLVNEYVWAERRRQTQQAQRLYALMENTMRGLEQGTQLAGHHDIPEYIGLFIQTRDSRGLRALGEMGRAALSGKMRDAQAKLAWIESRARAAQARMPRAEVPPAPRR